MGCKEYVMGRRKLPHWTAMSELGTVGQARVMDCQRGRIWAMRMSSRALLALVMLGAVTGSASAENVYTLKIGCVLDPQHPLLVGGRRMAGVGENGSGGRLKINLFSSSQLRGPPEVPQNVQAGLVGGWALCC